MDTRPFTDDEKRFVLAEAIRRSSIPVEKLSDLVNEYFPTSSWPLNDMLFPHGRTPNQCKEVFENPRPSPSVPSFQPQHQSQSQIHSPNQILLGPISSVTSSAVKRKSTPGGFEPYSPGPAPKRRQSSSDPVTIARDIRPKPSNTGSPLSQAPFPTTEPKKRGRPSKKDVERKQMEAIARGEVLPLASSSSMMSYQTHGEDISTPGYLPILPAISSALQHAPGPGVPFEREIPESAGSPGKQRRTKATPKSSKTGPKQPGESSFKVNPTITSMIEPEQTQTMTSRAESMTAPLAGLVEGPRTVPSNFPPVSTAPPSAAPTPTQQASDT